MTVPSLASITVVQLFRGGSEGLPPSGAAAASQVCRRRKPRKAALISETIISAPVFAIDYTTEVSAAQSESGLQIKTEVHSSMAVVWLQTSGNYVYWGKEEK
jgi:hypothetical protein